MSTLAKHNESTQQKQCMNLNNIEILTKCYQSPFAFKAPRTSIGRISQSPRSNNSVCKSNHKSPTRQTSPNKEALEYAQKMMQITEERKSTEDNLHKVENRINKIAREESKIRKRMELTQKLGQKLSDIKDQKLEEEIKRIEYLNLKEKQTNRNRRKIAYIRKQIAENIKEQKTKLSLIASIFQRNKEMIENNIQEYAMKAMSTLQQFKNQHQKSLKNDRIRSQKRNEIRDKYLSKINEIDNYNRRNMYKIKKLESIESSILDKLK